MADDTSTATADQAADQQDTDSGDGAADYASDQGGRDDAQLPEGARKALAAARKDAREAVKAQRALETRIREFEDRDKTDQQKLEERAAAAERAATDSTRTLARIQAAMAVGLEYADADLVTGETPEQMKASAQRLAERFGARTADFDAGARTTGARPVDMNDLIRRGRSTR